MDHLCDLCLVFNFNFDNSGQFCDNFQQEKEKQKLGKLTLVQIKLVDFFLCKHIFLMPVLFDTLKKKKLER